MACLDYVEPTPIFTEWGLGGTCVNVGCIPKKIMHQAAILGHGMDDAKYWGWEPIDSNNSDAGKFKNNWPTLVENTTNYIKKLNFTSKTNFQHVSKFVDYFNKKGQILDTNTVLAKSADGAGDDQTITAKNILIATGCRPTYLPEINNQYVITSDDLFKIKYNPGKVLIVGASYIALECAGLLNGLGHDVSVMVRSIFLRGFDQEIAQKIADSLENNGVKMIKKETIKSIEEIREPVFDENKPGRRTFSKEPGLYKVSGKNGHVENYNTIIIAIGREPNVKALFSEDNMDKNIENFVHEKSRKILVNDFDQTKIDNIYAIGDIAHSRPELTPAAILAGKNLARRLFFDENTKPTDYINIPTTVFTPLEYSSCGYHEEQAEEKFGKENILTYVKEFPALESALKPSIIFNDDDIEGKEDPSNIYSKCFIKMIVDKNNEQVLGLHYLGPNAGEVMQGFAVALKLKAKKSDIDQTIGIHPTTAEMFTKLEKSKQEGETGASSGCAT